MERSRPRQSEFESLLDGQDFADRLENVVLCPVRRQYHQDGNQK